MIHNIKILDSSLDKLDEINKESFSFEKFEIVNSQIQATLDEINLKKLYLQKNNFSEDNLKIFKNLLDKIDKIEKNILPKAQLLEEFSKSKS